MPFANESRTLVLVSALFSACGQSADPAGGSGGSGHASGGDVGTGGFTASGGATSSGGAAAVTGGASTSGGSGNSGGASTSGGGSSGGALANGGSSGSVSAGTSGTTTNGGAASNGGGSAGTSSGGVTGGSSGTGGAAGGGAGAGGSGGSGAGKRLTCPAGPFPAPMVMSTKSVCQNFAFNHTFNEGPTWIESEKAFFFTNFVVRSAMPGDIIKYTPGGNCEVFIRDVGCNGLAASIDGNLLAACHKSRSVIRFDIATKQPTTLADGFMGMMLDTPNDLVQHSNGSIYFTNPNYELDGRPAGFGLATFRIDPSGTMSLIRQGACNGIGLSPDEKKLYVLLSGMWDLDAQGVPSNRTTLFTGGDGMAVDCAGNIYASGSIFSPTGQNLGSWGTGTNLAFGGVDGKTVLVVGGGTAVRELQLNLPGLP